MVGKLCGTWILPEGVLVGGVLKGGKMHKPRGICVLKKAMLSPFSPQRSRKLRHPVASVHRLFLDEHCDKQSRATSCSTCRNVLCLAYGTGALEMIVPAIHAFRLIITQWRACFHSALLFLLDPTIGLPAAKAPCARYLVSAWRHSQAKPLMLCGPCMKPSRG
jgi:hypothetical protein